MRIWDIYTYIIIYLYMSIIYLSVYMGYISICLCLWWSSIHQTSAAKAQGIGIQEFREVIRLPGHAGQDVDAPKDLPQERSETLSMTYTYVYRYTYIYI